MQTSNHFLKPSDFFMLIMRYKILVVSVVDSLNLRTFSAQILKANTDILPVIFARILISNSFCSPVARFKAACIAASCLDSHSFSNAFAFLSSSLWSAPGGAPPERRRGPHPEAAARPATPQHREGQ